MSNKCNIDVTIMKKIPLRGNHEKERSRKEDR